MSADRSVCIQCDDESATKRLAAVLASALPTQVVIGLIGTLGAGKTHLVRDIVGALGGRREDVVSPTFVLCQHYECPTRRINHLDAYRIKDDDEFLELGVEELFFDSDGITFVEWSERVEACLPDERIDIELEVVGQTSRLIRVTAHGAEFQGVISDLSAWLKS